MLNSVPNFSKHSIESYVTLPVELANASKPQLLEVCCWCWVFTQPTWNLSIRSKATWAKSFLMLLAYCKQIIQNQRKTVRRAVTINVCWRKSSCEIFPLATTHAKVANSGSGKIVIARYPIRFFSKKSGAIANAPGKLARYCPALQLPHCPLTTCPTSSLVNGSNMTSDIAKSEKWSEIAGLDTKITYR